MKEQLPSYSTLLPALRGKNIREFISKHDYLTQEARKSNDYTRLAEHYYEFMTPIIEAISGKILYQPAPEYPNQSKTEAIIHFHQRLARLLQLTPEKHALDIACCYGDAVKDIALYTGSHVTGVASHDNHVNQANIMFENRKLTSICKVVRSSSYDNLPFADKTFDCAYTIGPLKYFNDIQLVKILKEVHRVLKKDGILLLYGYVKNENNIKEQSHKDLLEEFEYSVALFPSRTNEEILTITKNASINLISEFDLSQDLKWYYYLQKNPVLQWMVSSTTVFKLIEMGEKIRLLPKDFSEFNKIFLATPVRCLVQLGKLDILSCSKSLDTKKG